MTNRTVLLTGCSSGIGNATARAFLDAEWTVYATARDPNDITDLAEAGCETLALDVTDGEQVRSVVEQVHAEAGRIDCLVNNAGIGQYGPVEEIPIGAVHRQYDVNVYGPHRLIRAVLPHMRDRGDGTIINLSSVTARVVHPGGGVYGGSKAALEAMSDALRAEVAPFGIDVVLIEPGPVDTSFRDRAEDDAPPESARTGEYSTFYRLFEDAKLLGGSGIVASDPEDVAAVILNAASCTNPASRYPVGQFAKLALLGRYVPDRWRDRAYGLLSRVVN
ncbi:MAG: SDR family oxidoreductase [Halobacteriales archaeon]